MKLDYLRDGSDDCPLLRLYDFDSAEAQRLCQLFESLANGVLKRISLTMVESVDGTQLTFVLGLQDRGVIEINTQHVVIELTNEGWRSVAELAAQSTEEALGYQWLIPPLVTGAQLLLSRNGDW